MAHEITHILQGIKRHSATGVMKAKWGREDFFEMGRKRLDFTPEDVDFICRGLDARATRQASATLIAPE